VDEDVLLLRLDEMIALAADMFQEPEHIQRPLVLDLETPRSKMKLKYFSLNQKTI
jgi:hypothetical protein